MPMTVAAPVPPSVPSARRTVVLDSSRDPPMVTPRKSSSSAVARADSSAGSGRARSATSLSASWWAIIASP